MLYNRLVPLSGKDVIKILQRLGWAIKSQRGSHVKMIKEGKITIVPVHGKNDLGRGLVKAIEKQTGEKIL